MTKISEKEGDHCYDFYVVFYGHNLGHRFNLNNDMNDCRKLCRENPKCKITGDPKLNTVLENWPIKLDGRLPKGRLSGVHCVFYHFTLLYIQVTSFPTTFIMENASTSRT